MTALEQGRTIGEVLCALELVKRKQEVFKHVWMPPYGRTRIRKQSKPRRAVM
jgi:hypothetical protein